MIQSPDNRMLRRRTTTILGTTAAQQTQNVLSEDATEPLLIAHQKKELGGGWGEGVGVPMTKEKEKRDELALTQLVAEDIFDINTQPAIVPNPLRINTDVCSF